MSEQRVSHLNGVLLASDGEQAPVLDGQLPRTEMTPAVEMAANEALAPVAPAATPADSSPLLTPEENVMIDFLSTDWRGSQENNLSLRLATGRRLNQLCGPPYMSNDRARWIIQAFCAKAGQPAIDVPAMRQFAHQYSTLEAFRLAHPGVKGWTATKRLLGGPSRAKKAAPDPETIADRLLSSLRRLHKELRQVSPSLEDHDRELIAVQLHKMLKGLPQVSVNGGRQTRTNPTGGDVLAQPRPRRVTTAFDQLPGPEPTVS